METNNPIWLGDQLLTCSTSQPDGQYVEIEDERFYRISDFDAMDDFFITLISATNHWSRALVVVVAHFIPHGDVGHTEYG